MLDAHRKAELKYPTVLKELLKGTYSDIPFSLSEHTVCKESIAIMKILNFETLTDL